MSTTPENPHIGKHDPQREADWNDGFEESRAHFTARIAELEAQVERMRLALEWAHERDGAACACGEAGEHPEDCPVANALSHPLIGGAK